MNAALAQARGVVVPPMHPLPPVFPFSWAVAHGQDRFGLWQAFEVNSETKADGRGNVKAVRQKMRWLPPGRFMMGSPETESVRSDIEDLHPVALTHGTWLAATAVSHALWTAVMGMSFMSHPQLPVTGMSWTDINERFLPRLNAMVPGLALRLPWEAEWEFGAREAGRAQGPYSFGAEIDASRANFGSRGEMPVDHFEPNALGLFCMHGNTWEWCADIYADHQGVSERRDPQGPREGAALAGESAADRVVRGGSWHDEARSCRSASRNNGQTTTPYGNISFRLARSAS